MADGRLRGGRGGVRQVEMRWSMGRCRRGGCKTRRDMSREETLDVLTEDGPVTIRTLWSR